MKEELTKGLLRDFVVEYAYWQEPLNNFEPNTLSYTICLNDIDRKIERLTKNKNSINSYIREQKKLGRKSQELDDKIQEQKRYNAEIKNLKEYKIKFLNRVELLVQECLKENPRQEIIDKIAFYALGKKNFNINGTNDILDLARYNRAFNETVLYCYLNEITDTNLHDSITLMMNYLGVPKDKKQELSYYIRDTGNSVQYYKFLTSLIEFEHEKLYVEKNLEMINKLLDDGQRYVYRAGEMSNEDNDEYPENQYSILTELEHIHWGSNDDDKWDSPFLSVTESFPVMAVYSYATEKQKGKTVQKTDTRVRTMAIDLVKLKSMLEEIKKKQELVGKVIAGRDDEKGGLALKGEYDYLQILNERLKESGNVHFSELLDKKLEDIERQKEPKEDEIYKTPENMPTDILCYGRMSKEEMIKRQSLIVGADRKKIIISEGSKDRVRSEGVLKTIFGLAKSSAEILFKHGVPKEAIREISPLEFDFIQATELWSRDKRTMELVLDNPNVIDEIVLSLIDEISLEDEELEFLSQYYYEKKSTDEIVAYFGNNGDEKDSDKKREFECAMRSIISDKIFGNDEFRNELISVLLGKSKREIVEQALDKNEEAHNSLISLFKTIPKDIRPKGELEEIGLQAVLKGSIREYIRKIQKKYGDDKARELSGAFLDIQNSLQESSEEYRLMCGLCAGIKSSQNKPNIIPHNSSKSKADEIEIKEEKKAGETVNSIVIVDEYSSPSFKKFPITIFTAKTAMESLKSTITTFGKDIKQGIRSFFGIEEDNEER